MKRIIIAATAASIAASSASAVAPPSITGRWATDDGKAIVDIYACGAKLCGKVHKLLIKQPAGGQRDERNPDKAKRTRHVSGLQIYWDLAADGNAWKGQGYSPEDGRYYKAHLTPKGNKMSMKGCVSVFCKTVTWTKMI